MLNQSQMPLVDVESKRYTLPPPADNRAVTNTDISLGGYKIDSPFWVPVSDFRDACERTPQSDYFTRIIPWDDKNGEFVFAALPEECLMDKFEEHRIDRRQLKQYFDSSFSKRDFRSPVRKYPVCVYLNCAVFILFIIMFPIITWVGYPDRAHQFAREGNLWFFILFPVIFSLILLLLCAIGSKQSKGYTVSRNQQLWMTCDRINRTCPDKGWRIFPGEYGAWLEVHVNPEAVEENSDYRPPSNRSQEAWNNYPQQAQVQEYPQAQNFQPDINRQTQSPSRSLNQQNFNQPQVFYEVPVASTPRQYDQNPQSLMSDQKPYGNGYDSMTTKPLNNTRGSSMIDDSVATKSQNYQNPQNVSTFEFDRPVNSRAGPQQGQFESFNNQGNPQNNGYNAGNVSGRQQSSRNGQTQEPLNPYWSYQSNENSGGQQNRNLSPNRNTTYSPKVIILSAFLDTS